jgi:diadenylate cyclase
MELTSAWLRYAIELLLLAAVLYAGLSFLSRSRGDRVLKGLLIAVLLWAMGLFGLAYALDLQELEYVLRGAFSAALVVLAVVFQPELRRAFAELGSRRASSQGGLQKGLLAELARAACAMAQRRTGALVAIEGKHPLDAWIHTGEPVGAELRSGLVESLFAKESHLHDGALIVRDGRIEAAACMLPLSDRSDLPPHFGTRHRAAVGLSEETDALLLVVSEESGAISLFSEGVQQGPIAPGELVGSLERAARAAFEGEGSRGGAERLWAVLAWLRRESVPLLGSLLFASLLLVFAHGELAVTESLEFEVSAVSPGSGAPSSEALQLVLRLPDERFLMRSAPEAKLSVRGTRTRLDDFKRRARAELALEVPAAGALEIEADELRWNVDTVGLELGFEPALEIELEEQAEHDLALSPENLVIDSSGLETRFQLDLAQTQFDPSTVRLRGPAALVAQCVADPERLALEPIRLTANDALASSRHLQLSLQNRNQGLRLVDVPSVRVTLAPRPVEIAIGTVTREVALVCLDPARRAELERWSLPPHSLTASFQVVTRGLLPAGPAGPGSGPQSEAIRRFVNENLAAYVDVSELKPDGSSQVLKVRTAWRQDWAQSLWPSLFPGVPGPRQGEQLSVFLESDEELFLELRSGPIPPPSEGD